MDPYHKTHPAYYIALVVLGIIVLSLLVPLSDGLGLAGFFGDKTYLIILQDNDEIRPTGGLMSCVGVLTLHNGKVTRLQYYYSHNSPELQTIVSLDGPESLTKFFNVDSTMLLNSNVQYDFASFAPKMRADFQNVTGQKIDGVIALDLTAVQEFMKLTGPVMISGEVVTDRNVVDRLHFYSATENGSKTPLTSLISTVTLDLLRITRDSNVLEKLAFYSTLRSLQDEKHVLAYPNSGFFFTKAGDERPAGADFVSVVDATLGTGKADFGVNRSIDYRVELLSNGSAVVNLTLTYVNDCWWNYKVFSTTLVPAGAELLTARNATDDFKGPEVTGGTDFTAFSSRLLVAGNSSGSVTYVYKIPNVVQNSVLLSRYDLYVQKQAGIIRYTLNVNVTVPPGATLIRADNVGSSLVLNEDAHISIVYV
jgi:hypothetical protein